MKKQLLIKIYAFIVTTMMFSESAIAQIVYTDVNPDSTMSCSGGPGIISANYYLDLDNDANNDFILTASYHSPPQHGIETTSRVSASPLNGNAVKDTNNVSIPLQFNAVIDGNLLLNQSWDTSGTQSLKYGRYGGGGVDTVFGLWDSLSDYYLGLRLLQSGQTYYGWVRLRVDVTQSYASVIIRDYAYNSFPDQPILAGQTTTTGIIEHSLASSINLFPNPARDKLTIALPSINEKVEVTITDISGKTIYYSKVTQTQQVEVNTKDFTDGIYVVQIQAGEFMGTKKLIVQR